MITSYDFQNQVRDVVPILDYINQNNPKLISKIALGAVARNKTHEWTEGILAGKKFAGTAEGLVITADSAAGLAIGMKVQPVASADVFVVAGVAANKVTVAKLDEAMGNPPTEKTTYKVYGAAVTSGSKTGEEVAWQGKTRLNYTQIFRKDASLTGTAVATSTYDNANNMNVQVMNAMELLQADLNFAIWHGRKSLGGANVASTMGGIYEFCNAIVEDGKGKALSVDTINAVITKIIKAGGRPNVIVMARDLAPAVSAIYKDQVIIGEDSNVRGMYVNKIKDAFGNILDVVYDDEVPAGHLWIMDINKIKLSPMEGRTFTDKDSTLPGFDGFSRSIIGEYTLEIYNPDECFGRIENIG
jgi:hypothetical protein